jgi:hypothetical protein
MITVAAMRFAGLRIAKSRFRVSSGPSAPLRIVAVRAQNLRKEAIVRARQAEMFAQRRPFVVAPKQAAAP